MGKPVSLSGQAENPWVFGAGREWRVESSGPDGQEPDRATYALLREIEEKVAGGVGAGWPGNSAKARSGAPEARSALGTARNPSGASIVAFRTAFGASFLPFWTAAAAGRNRQVPQVGV